MCIYSIYTCCKGQINNIIIIFIHSFSVLTVNDKEPCSLYVVYMYVYIIVWTEEIDPIKIIFLR